VKHVFISYSRKDYDDFVKNFIAELQDAKIPVWIDQKGLPLGTPDWEQTIRDAIRDAEAVLLVASVNSRKSEVVRDELEVARMEQIPIYPVWAKGEDNRYSDCVPLGYSYRQRLDMREGHYEEGLQTLLKALRGEDYHPVLDRAKHAAQEWDAAGRPDYLLWVWEQQAPVHEVIEQLKPDLDEVTQAFLVPEYERLLEQFKSAPDYRQETIIERWVEIGEPCIHLIVNVLMLEKSPDKIAEIQISTALIKALRSFQNISTEYFNDLLQNQDPLIRIRALELMEEVLGKQSLPFIRSMLHDNNPRVLRSAIKILGKLRDYQSLTHIIQFLDYDESSVKLSAIYALKQFIEDQSLNTRWASLFEVEEWDDTQLLPSLIPLLHDKDIRVRCEVILTLQKLANKYEVISYLSVGLYDDDTSVRILVLNVFEELQNLQSVPFLIDLLEDHTPIPEESTISLLAAWVLSQMKTTESRKALREWRKKYPELAISLKKYSNKRYRFSARRNPLSRDEDD
jgi:HEAT repeat protein